MILYEYILNISKLEWAAAALRYIGNFPQTLSKNGLILKIKDYCTPDAPEIGIVVPILPINS